MNKLIGCYGNDPLGIGLKNVISFIHSQSSTNPANFAKMGPVDVGIIGLTEITKNILKHQNLRFAKSEWADD